MMTLQDRKSEHKITLLLTATVAAGDVIFCDRRDTQTRLDDYLRAFRFWIGEPLIHRIVLVENSGFDLGSFRELVSKFGRANLEVELLSFVQPPFAPTLGKSFGEAKIIEYALQHSTLLDDSSFVLKCTGRYFATNFFRVWPLVAANDLPYVMVNFYQYPAMCDSRFFGADKSFFECFFKTSSAHINDERGYYFEMALADAATAAKQAGQVISPLPGGGMLIDGVQASTNSAYRYPYWKRLTYRAIARIRNGLPLRFRVGAPTHRPGQGSKT